MSIGTLYTTPDFSKGKRIKAVAAIAGVKFDDPVGYVHRETNLTPEYKAKFASGKIPAFEGKDGFKLFETTAIARYIAAFGPNTTLLGSGGAKDAALVDQWVSYFDNELGAQFLTISHLLRNVIPYNKALDTQTREKLARPFGVLEAHLETNTFLVADRLSLADITGASVLFTPFEYILDIKWRDAHPNIIRWYNTVVNQPKLKPVFGETLLIDVAKTWTPPPKEEKKKADKPAAAAEPKKPKEKPAPAPKEADEEEEEPSAASLEPKKKNPLEDLPKTSFNYEDWKRAYSNLDTRGPGGSVEWFYKHFDFEGNSVWKVDYKFNDELKEAWKSNNQIGGFFQRLEGSRKWLFGTLVVLGTDNDNLITGVFILRGQDHILVVDAAPDWPSYDFRKLDLTESGSAEDKAFFEAALAWDLEVDGKKFNQGKAFK